MLAVYVAQASLFSIVWAEKFGQDDVDGMIKRCLVAFDDYDNYRSTVPKWYNPKYTDAFKSACQGEKKFIKDNTKH